MPSMSTGRFFAETVKGYNITHAFFVPSIFNTAIAEMDNLGITAVTTHHEVAAAYMADGYARAARRPGLLLTQAVGAANAAAGLREAFLAGAPVIALTGSSSPLSRYKHLYQIIEDFPMFEPVTKLNARVERPERLPDLLRQAFRVATTGNPGPVHLELPGRLGEGVEGRGDFEILVEGDYSRIPAHRPEAEMGKVKEAAAALAAAKKPAIVVGGGVAVSGAASEMVDLAEKLSIPVAYTLNGKETIPEDHPLNVGLVGTYGRWTANALVQEADLVFFMGTRAGGHATNNWKVPRPGVATIQMDIDPAEIGRNYPAKVGLVGDSKVTLRRLLEVVEPVSARPEWTQRLQYLKAQWQAEVELLARSESAPIRPERICREITEFLPEGAVVVVDTGHAATWAGSMLGLRYPGQRFIRCAGTLGWAFPASLGVKCALPDRPVLCFAGDGGAFYHLSELETAVRMDINVVLVVNNNGALSQTKKFFDAGYGGEQRGGARDMWVFRQTNFAAVAEAIGCLGIRVEKPGEIQPALERAFSAGKPAVVDIISDIEAFPTSPLR